MEYRYCKDCEKINDRAGKFCPYCGKEYISEKSRRCLSCGNIIRINDSFCTWCGEKCAPVKGEYVTYYELEADEVSVLSESLFTFDESELTEEVLKNTEEETDIASDIISESDETEETVTEQRIVPSEEQDKSENESNFSFDMAELLKSAEEEAKLSETPESYVPEFNTSDDVSETTEEAVVDIVDGFDIERKDNDIILKAYKGNMEEVVIPREVTMIGSSAFYRTNIKSVSIPYGVIEIHDYAFSSCYDLTRIVIPDSVKVIESSAFRWCINLSRLKISDQTVSIGKGAFYNCPLLKSVEIPKSVEIIGKLAFGYYFKKGIVSGYKDVKLKDFCIRCYKGTAGEKYAKENGFRYELIG